MKSSRLQALLFFAGAATLSLVLALQAASTLSYIDGLSSSFQGSSIKHQGKVLGLGTVAGCGATSGGTSAYDQSACGNVTTDGTAESYEPGYNDSSASTITCGRSITANGSYKLTSNLNCGSGSSAFTVSPSGGANNILIDLKGYTVTGYVTVNDWGGPVAGGIHIFNGNINCNTGTSSTNNGACVYVTTTNGSTPPTSPNVFHHLTIQNSGNSSSAFSIDGSFSSRMSGAQTTGGPYSDVIHHATVTIVGGVNGSMVSYRAGAGGVAGTNRTVHIYNNYIANGDANTNHYTEGWDCYNTYNCDIHNNYFNPNLVNVSDTVGRMILLDGDAYGNGSCTTCMTQNANVYNNYFNIKDLRALRHRSAKNVNFHDNLIDNVQDPPASMGNTGTVHFGDMTSAGPNNTGVYDLGATTYQNNVFVFTGPINAEGPKAFGDGYSAVGVTISNNAIKCVNNGCSGIGGPGHAVTVGVQALGTNHYADVTVTNMTYDTAFPYAPLLINGSGQTQTSYIHYSNAGTCTASGGAVCKAVSGGDTSSPTVPVNLTASVISSSQINLFWSASADNVAVSGYNVYRNGSKIAAVTGTAYSDTGLSAATAYSYTVSAYDAAGNTSPQSLAVSVTTQSLAATPSFVPSGGTYTSAQTVVISCATPNSTIYYTTNNTVPTHASLVYSSAVNVSTSKTIKAICSAGGYVDSSMATAAFTINLPTFTIGGTISGLSGSLVLQNNVGDNYTASANGSFTFATALTSGSNYNVTVFSQPSGQTCSVSNGSGTVGSANVTNVNITCSTGTVSPVITNAQVILINTDGATVSWTTDVPATGQVNYGKTSAYGQSTALNSTLTISHSVALSGLARKTTYHIQLVSADGSGHAKTSPDASFTTLARMSKSPKIVNLTAANGSIILSWQSPVDGQGNNYELWAGTAVFKSTTGFVTDPSSASPLANLAAPAASYHDINVVAGTTYYYSVFAYDDLNSYSDPSTLSFTPTAASGGGGGNSGGGGSGYVPPIVTPPASSTASSTLASSSRLINDKGTYYLIKGSQRFGITSPGILFSYGFDFKDAKAASTPDLSLPLGSLLLPGNGYLVKSKEDPTVYLISNGQRHGFVSEQVFRSLGFSFERVFVVTNPELQLLPKAADLDNGQVAHLPGTDINRNGTIYWVGPDNKLHGYPSMNIYNSWHPDNDFSSVVPANSADVLLPIGDEVTARAIE